MLVISHISNHSLDYSLLHSVSFLAAACSLISLQDVSALLLKKMSEKATECAFHICAQEYKLDFTRMTQINVSTGFERSVRCRPIYRSPDSMQPHLQWVSFKQVLFSK